MGTHPVHRQSIAKRRLVGGATAAIGLAAAVVITALRDDSGLGAPHYWAWLLTTLQVLSLWSAGQGRWWGWLVGGSVQIPWIAYAVVTDQIGFIPGCAVSASVQIYSFLRTTGPRDSTLARLKEVTA